MSVPPVVRLVFCLALALISAACTHLRSQPVSAVRYHPTESWRVDIYYSNPRRPHVVLAKIVISSPHGLDRFQAEERVREEAARYGAHAIIVDKRPGFGVNDRGSYQGIYGRAVRWTGPPEPEILDW